VCVCVCVWCVCGGRGAHQRLYAVVDEVQDFHVLLNVVSIAAGVFEVRAGHGVCSGVSVQACRQVAVAGRQLAVHAFKPGAAAQQ
jgi:hypothetical protein